MMITWNSFLGRRDITLEGIVKAYGFNYEQLCNYFSQRGASYPSRTHPEVLELFGPPKESVAPAAANDEPIVEAPAPKKKVRMINASIKNTKKELLDICKRLQLDDVNDRLTKANILSALEKTGKVKVLNVKTKKQKK